MISKVAGAAVQGATQVASPQKAAFPRALGVARPPPALKPPPPPTPPAPPPRAQALIGEVASAQARLDKILSLAQSGKTFSPAELLAFQAHAYRASQELDLAGKVVEKATSGVKQTLNTQV
jgi:hypothetical protein